MLLSASEPSESLLLPVLGGAIWLIWVRAARIPLLDMAEWHVPLRGDP